MFFLSLQRTEPPGKMTFTVVTSKGVKIPFQIEPDATVQKLRQSLHAETGVEPECQHLRLGRRVIGVRDEHFQLSTLELEGREILFRKVKPRPGVSRKDDGRERDPSTQLVKLLVAITKHQTLTLTVKGSTRVGTLRRMVQKKQGLVVSDQRLLVEGGEELRPGEDDKTVTELGLDGRLIRLTK